MKERRTKNIPPKRLSGVIDVTRSGRGFLIQEGKDIPIPREGLGRALSGDIVEVALRQGKTEVIGRVVRVIERKSSSFVGEIVKDAIGMMLRPDDPRVYFGFKLVGLPSEALAKEGQKAIVDVVEWEADPPMAKIREVIGKAGDNETEMRAIALSRGFDSGFPKPVMDAAEILSNTRVFDIRGREDFRDVLTLTIDPPDAKDFDDAISLKTLPDGNREVGIHIADVSHFVTPGSTINQEAVKRATSVYLVDRTIPMLPPQLSEDLCSLKPDEDRLVFSAVFTVTPDNEVVGRRFTKGIINSKKRFTYDEADASLKDAALPYHAELSSLWNLSSKLRKARMADGAIMFDNDELKPVLNEQKEVVSFRRIVHTESHQLIEELMLLANREVAEYVSKKLGKKNRLFVYRIHDVPKAEKIEELSVFLRAIGYTLTTKGARISAKDLNKMLTEIKGTPEEYLVKTATVRSMAKAVYATTNIGHFGLSFNDYTNFTSPIRRYPDIMVHRVLTTLIADGRVSDDPARQAELAFHCSEREAAAAEAERASVKLKQVEYFAKLMESGPASPRLRRAGVVSGVTEWGLYLQDSETGAEGMCRLASMTDDSYTYDPTKFAAIGAKTKRVIRLGDAVTFVVDRVDLEMRTIDLRIVQKE
jgi:ribonuclease R